MSRGGSRASRTTNSWVAQDGGVRVAEAGVGVLARDVPGVVESACGEKPEDRFSRRVAPKRIARLFGLICSAGAAGAGTPGCCDEGPRRRTSAHR